MSVAQNQEESAAPEMEAPSQLAKIVQELVALRPHTQRSAVDSQVLERVRGIEQGTLAVPEMASLRSAHGEEIERLAVLDQLTELYNVKTFFKELKDAIKRATRYHRSVSLGLLTVDGLKELAQQYDSLTGDAVLRICGHVIRETIREGDIPARYTADRFGIIFPDTAVSKAAILAESLRQRIGTQAVSHNWKNLKITASIGLAAYPASAQMYDELIARSEQALELAIMRGGDRVCVF